MDCGRAGCLARHGCPEGICASEPGVSEDLRALNVDSLMAAKIIRIGVIGAGRIGKIHAENIARRIAGAQLAGVADVNLTAAQDLAEQLHTSWATGNYQELLDHPGVDAVAICSA